MTGSDLFVTYTTGIQPRISNALSNLLAGDYDVSRMRSRERAEFLFGLNRVMATMIEVGWVEHTNDWDWYVQIELSDGRMFGDYCKDGVLYDYEDPIWGEDGNEVIYCNSFVCNWDKDSYKFFVGGPGDEAYDTYYPNLKVTVEEDGVGTVEKHDLKVGDISRIVISQR